MANKTNISKFEATMMACQKAKLEKSPVSAKKPSAKKVVESKKNAVKRANRQTESILKKTIKIMEEYEDEDEMDPEAELPKDTATDAMVVIDPEMSTDEYEAGLDDLEAIIDETPEGEVPSTDEYVGDYVYTCPICGNNFFSETEMGSDTCPVCGEEVDEFVLVGGVESPDEALGGDEDDMSDEDMDPEIDDSDIEDVTDEEVPEDEEDPVEEGLDPDTDNSDESACESRKRSMKKRNESRKSSGLKVDESTFNPFLTKFIKENYKNASSMTVVGAKLCGKALRLECKIKFKSGKVTNTTISMENFKKSARPSVIAAGADKAFKIESRSSKVAPFVFECVTTPSGIISCEGFKYSFITKKEGKSLQIYGKYAIKESARRGRK